MSEKYLIVVVGPTASGKTDLGIKLAKYYNTEVVSADSRQIYKKLYIGTAQPTFEEKSQVKHNLVDFVDLDKDYNVADYESDSLKVINRLFESKDYVVVVGGSGLYIKSLCEGLDYIPAVPESVKHKVDLLFRECGNQGCVDELCRLDNHCSEYIDLKNPVRVLRALKVIKTTGKPIYSYYNHKNRLKKQFNVFYIGINLDKSILVNNINTRVDKMIKNGLIDEARSVVGFRKFKSLQTIGYKEIFDFFDGNIKSLEDAVHNIKRNTKLYAKRQMTWFKKNKEIFWFENPIFENVLDVTNRQLNL